MARTRAKDYDEKRAAILHAAARIFAEGGFDRTSMATLAAECGVSKALLYHYYASKEALLHDIYDLMRHGAAPARRQRLAPAFDGGATFWKLRR